MEQALIFEVDGDTLPAVLHPGNDAATRGVLIVVGGPQYRVGSHRQFLLLARELSARGIPVLRFDYRGMGDAKGSRQDFSETGDDLSAAVDAFMQRRACLREIVIWGLCDAASAALLHAWRDPRISGLVLLNPWVRTEEGLARAYLKHYYARRVFSRSFWAGLMRGHLNLLASVRSLIDLGSRASGHRQDEGGSGGSLPERMAEGWKRFPGSILLILSGEDLTAAEFRDTAVTSKAWQGLLTETRVTQRVLPAANHTFSRREWRNQVADWTAEWLAG